MLPLFIFHLNHSPREAKIKSIIVNQNHHSKNIFHRFGEFFIPALSDLYRLIKSIDKFNIKKTPITPNIIATSDPNISILLRIYISFYLSRSENDPSYHIKLYYRIIFNLIFYKLYIYMVQDSSL